TSQIQQNKNYFTYKGGYYHHEEGHHHKSTFTAGGELSLKTAENATLSGVDMQAGKGLSVKADGRLQSITPQDYVIHAHKVSRKGSFGKQKVVESHHDQTQAVRNRFVGKDGVTLESRGDNLQQAPQITSQGPVRVVSEEGVTAVTTAGSTTSSSYQKNSQSSLWVSHKNVTQTDETLHMAEVDAPGPVEIRGHKGTGISMVVGQDKPAPYTDWAKDYKAHPDVQITQAQEVHAYDKKTQKSLGPAASALVAITIAVASMGTGLTASAATFVCGEAAAGTATAAATTGYVMTSAAFTSALTQTGVSLVSNQGNLNKVRKEVIAKKFAKNVAIAAATAGIADKVIQATPLSTMQKGFNRSLLINGVKATTSAALTGAIEGGSLKTLALGALRNTVANTAAETIASHAGEQQESGVYNYAEHKLAHFIGGAISQAIVSKDPLSGAITGGAAAVAAEMMAERLEGWAAESAKGKIGEEAKAGVVSEARQQAIYRDEIQKVAQITKVAVAAGAALTGLDVMAASNAAETALENNFQATHDELPAEEEEGPFSPRLKRTKLARHKKKYIDPLVEYGRATLKEEVLDPIAQSSAGQAAAPYLTMAKNEAGKAVNSFLDQPATMPMLGLAATLSGKDLPKLPGQEHLWTTRDMLNGASLAVEGLASGTRKTLRFLGAKPETAQDTTDILGSVASLIPVSKIATAPKAVKALTKATPPVKAVPKLDLSKTAAVKKIDVKKQRI
ncbi:MAG: DUF637 domain-containing protein, partial [Alphaproteobacteria bacterium]|nr:DUF637 domain-containing protein [Alphaproteobacteria bacterium]